MRMNMTVNATTTTTTNSTKSNGFKKTKRAEIKINF